MSKILFVNFEDAGNYTVIDKESEITQDQLAAVDTQEGELVRFNLRGDGVYERAVVDSETNENEIEDGEEPTTTYSIKHWAVIE